MSTPQTIAPATGGSDALKALAVVLHEPRRLDVRELALQAPDAGEVVVDVEWSGISTGTERLLWSGTMPAFPGMGYPLVPGYESVGRVAAAGPGSDLAAGTRVFVSGASCFGEVRGLFGGAASRLVVPRAKVTPIADHLGEQGTLLALAATAVHAVRSHAECPAPELIVGHGVLGRLVARVAVALGAADPVVWEIDERRADGARGYRVCHPDNDPRRDYARVCDVSGATGIVDAIVPHLARHGEIVLAGFYSAPVSFEFPPAFMREARLRIAAEWRPEDLAEACDLVSRGALSLDDLITHRQPASDASSAYRTAFSEPDCLKMILDWRRL